MHDTHTHDRQAIRFGEYINTLSSSPLALYNLSIDAFGNSEARNRFVSELNEGKLMTVYFGHGGFMFMGMDSEFFTTSDLSLLKNRHLGFTFLGGCDFSRPDNRRLGLGEGFVVGCENGMIGGVVSSRASLSIVNYELAKRIARSWLGRPYATASPTAGEFYAAAKSKSDYRNSLNYIYAGDPAVIFPVATQKISATPGLEIMAASKIKLKGEILDSEGKTDKGYNGKIVIKIAKPALRMQSRDYVTGTYRNPQELDTIFIDYKADILLSCESTVNDGAFDIEFVMPHEINRYADQLLPIYLSAYDNRSNIGAIGYLEGKVSSQISGASTIVEPDTIAPDALFHYDFDSDLINIICTDNAGLFIAPETITAQLDGDRIVPVSLQSHLQGECTKSAEYFYDAIGVESGKHKIELELTDIAGNRRICVYEFNKPEEKEDILLTVSSKAVLDELTVIVGTDKDVQLMIRDADGKTVLERDISEVYRWNCTDKDGEKLPAGIYRLRVVEKGEYVHRRSSQWQSVAIMD